MGYQIAEERRKASLLRQALNSASASIMLADENLRVVYSNASANRMFNNLEADFRKELPAAFQADKVIRIPTWTSSIATFRSTPP